MIFILYNEFQATSYLTIKNTELKKDGFYRFKKNQLGYFFISSSFGGTSYVHACSKSNNMILLHHGLYVGGNAE